MNPPTLRKVFDGLLVLVPTIAPLRCICQTPFLLCPRRGFALHNEDYAEIF